MPLAPLRFVPRFRRYLWGGRRLETLLGKSLPAGNDYAESWEVVERDGEQSVVAAGPWAGQTLGELRHQFGEELLGPVADRPFPLLFKFLDAHQKLSVQVHPNDTQAAQLNPPDLGKTEAWVILHADPGAYLYAGLKRGFDRAAFERELRRGTADLCLHRCEPQPGDCYFIPAGVLHALGEGLVVAEIQQASDTTFRLHDWNRLGADGRPRPLHLEAGLAVIDFDRGPVAPQRPLSTDRPSVQRLVRCPYFTLDRWQWSGTEAAGGDGRFHLLAVLEGEVTVAGDAANRPLRAGETMLLPASSGPTPCHAAHSATMLDIYLG